MQPMAAANVRRWRIDFLINPSLFWPFLPVHREQQGGDTGVACKRMLPQSVLWRGCKAAPADADKIQPRCVEAVTPRYFRRDIGM
jgi:hypothetical protein